MNKESIKIKKICNSKEGWKQFNKIMNEKHEKAACANYDELQARIMKTIEQTVGIKTITINNDKKWEPEII